MTVLIASCATAILVSFLCSLLEATLLSLDPLHLETRKREGCRYAEVWLGMKQRIDRPIAAILILNTVAHTGGATLAGGAFDELYGGRWIWLFSILFTLTILFGTEIFPKVFGVSHNERLAPILAPILAFITLALRPLIAVTEWFSRPFKRKGPKRQISIADLQTMADLAEAHRAIAVEQESIIINATRLRTASIASVMVPRERIAFFHTQKSNIENFEVAATTLHTRYPVSRDGTVDGINSYVNFKELVASAPSRREVRMLEFLRPLARLRADANLNEALKVLLRRRSHMVIVEDETGRVVGLVTLEDVLEEIVGDLKDEFDEASTEFIQVAEKRWKVGGAVRVGELAGKLGRPMPVSDQGQPLSDWLRQRIGRDLASGDIVRAGGVTFTVIQTRRRKAYRVLVEA
jgi:putative hemolysin